jgi:asparagine synthetase B (glutamine-hydrolysing)
MCGLVGMVIKGINGATSLDADVIEQLLYIDALRGEDSTGVCLFENDGDVRVLKEATTADYFLRSKEWASVRTAFVSRGKAILGHNRKATVGKTNDDNAHPFIIDNRYVFMHNGTLHTHKHLADVEIDSHALGIHLTKCEGDPQKIEQALSNVYGAYACVWLDQKLEKVYMLKNKERPLYIAETTSGLVYASEPAFIYAACVRNKNKVESVKQIEDDVLYTIDISKAGHSIKEDKLTVKKSTPLTTKANGGQGHKGTHKALGSLTEFGNDKEELSKNEFKRFHKQAIGKKFWFWMDDYVERSYPLDDGEWLVWGNSLSLKFKHSICAYLSGVPRNDLVSYYDGALLEGIIEDATYDVKTKCVNILMKDVTNVKKEVNEKTETTFH